MQLALKLLTLLGRAWLRLHGVVPGPGGWVHGRPVLRLTRGSVLRIGSNVTLNSVSRFNPLAPSGKVFFVTSTPHARITIGDGAGISNSIISCSESITIGAGAMIGPDCLIFDSDFHGLPLDSGKPTRTAPVQIGARVFIGTRTMVLKGVTIGDGAVIGAGSVISRDVPAGAVAAGSPARVLKSPGQNPRQDHPTTAA